MTTGNFTDWSGNMLDLGPLYPFVGWEGLMVVLAFIAWIGWHILQMRAEKKQHEDQARAAAPGRQSGQGRRGGAPRRAVLAARCASRGHRALRCRPCPKPRNVGGEARTTLQGSSRPVERATGFGDSCATRAGARSLRPARGSLESTLPVHGIGLVSLPARRMAVPPWRQSMSATSATRTRVTTMISVMSANRCGLRPTCWYWDQR